MKKAKFQDNYNMPAGSCVGHYSQQDKNCKICKLKRICIERTQKHLYPKNVKQVLDIIGNIRK